MAGGSVSPAFLGQDAFGGAKQGFIYRVGSFVTQGRHRVILYCPSSYAMNDADRRGRAGFCRRASDAGWR